MISVFVVDDHPVMRQGLISLLETTPDIRVCGESDTGAKALQQLNTVSCSVMVLDLALPDMTGLEVLERVVNTRPQLHVLIHTFYDQDQYALRAFKAGARGYVCKSGDPEALIEAIRTLHSGARYIPETAARLLAEYAIHNNVLPHERLSNREHQVLLGLSKGYTISEIARQGRLSPKTVSTYRTRVLEKMGLTSNADLVSYAQAHELT